MKKLLLTNLFFIVFLSNYAQIGIGTNNPLGALDVTSNNQGMLIPRVATPETDVANPDESEIVWDSTSRCFRYYYEGDGWRDLTPCTSLRIDCLGATLDVPVLPGQNNSSTGTIPYIGGNGENYNAFSGSSTGGVTGLFIGINAGTLNVGSGSIPFTIFGIPSGEGTAQFLITIAGESCTLDIPVLSPTFIDCASASFTPTTILSTDTSVSVFGSLPYTNGNSSSYSAQNIPSMGVSGLTLSVNAGTLNPGAGTIPFTITGNPSGNSSTASFAITIAGQSCTLDISVIPPPVVTATLCKLTGTGPNGGGFNMFCNSSTFVASASNWTLNGSIRASIFYDNSNPNQAHGLKLDMSITILDAVTGASIPPQAIGRHVVNATISNSDKSGTGVAHLSASGNNLIPGRSYRFVYGITVSSADGGGGSGPGNFIFGATSVSFLTPVTLTFN